MPTQLVLLLAFAVGLLLGSFLNVCIARLPYHESISKPRSHCPGCLHTLAWYDNIPLLSFAILRARCRKCFQPISWQYPLVELATGLWFSFVASRYLGIASNFATYRADKEIRPEIWAQAGCELTGLLILGFLLIGLFVMDWQTHILPDAFTLPGILIGFMLVCTQAIFLPTGAGDIHLHKQLRMSSPGSMVEKGNMFLTGSEVLVFGRLAAIVGAFLLLYLIRTAYRALRKKEGLGLGDAKLLAMIAAFLGWWPAILALFVGVLTCATYAVALLLRKRATPATRLPLGTFLALGGLCAAVFGPALIAWYANLL